ncbi:uncharacterized protein LOC107982121 [Nasonia vitripennis]|uniref:DUF4806 domain-containing protein n=1 Tax=Nasonia vitripennis TaxID=7425 RepID=A0A7M7T7Z4_NASVI|nr:uncharacterized protein LOC107982121 [Nasonia vitripennis]
MTLFDTRLQNLEELATKIYTTTKRETKKKSMVRKDRPAFLPFSTKEDLLLFDDASEDDYNAFVDYLSYLGGGNTSAAASTYFRKCIKMTEDLFSNLTWTGSKKQKLISSVREGMAIPSRTLEMSSLPFTLEAWKRVFFMHVLRKKFYIKENRMG